MGVRMSSSSDGGYRPSCMLAHHLINRLSMIVGFCDLLAEEAPESSACLRRLRQMREIATSAAEELSRHECELEEIMAPAAPASVKEPRPLREPVLQTRAVE
jgi:hypothetical protein